MTLTGDAQTEKAANPDAQHSSAWDRACHIFMYNPCVAVYILIFIFNFIWAIVLINASDDAKCKGS